MLGKYLESIGVRQANLAAVAGVSPGTLGDLLSGRRAPSVHVLRRLLHAIGELTGGAHPTADEVAALLDSLSTPRAGGGEP